MGDWDGSDDDWYDAFAGLDEDMSILSGDDADIGGEDVDSNDWFGD